FNLVGSLAGCSLTGATGDLVGANPLLGPLADNGGPTQTRALLAGSPAIDAAGACSGADQRGVTRPQGAACDIAAYEFACGNGIVDLSEQCDDGNLNGGTDCCSADCQFKPGGMSCNDDGDPCTVDSCDGSGVCIHVVPEERGSVAASPGGSTACPPTTTSTVPVTTSTTTTTLMVTTTTTPVTTTTSSTVADTTTTTTVPTTTSTTQPSPTTTS